MGYTGSIIIKKTKLIHAIENMKSMFNAPKIKCDAKHIVWGQQIGYERLLEDSLSKLNWNQYHQWNWERFIYQPADTFDWLFTVQENE